MGKSLKSAVSKRLSKRELERRNIALPTSTISTIREELLALEQRALSAPEPVKVLMEAILNHIELDEVAAALIRWKESLEGEDAPKLKKLAEEVEVHLDHYRICVRDPSLRHVTEIACEVLTDFVSVTYRSQADIERIQIFRHCLQVTLREFAKHRLNGVSSKVSESSIPLEFVAAVNKARAIVNKWPPDHDKFVWLAKSFGSPWSQLEVLPANLYWEKSDVRWKELRQKPEWEPLYQSIQNSAEREGEAIGKTIALILVFSIAAIAIHWMLLIVAMPLAVVASHMSSSRGQGFPAKDRFLNLGSVLREACVSDQLLYDTFVKDKIFRMRAARYGK